MLFSPSVFIDCYCCFDARNIHVFPLILAALGPQRVASSPRTSSKTLYMTEWAFAAIPLLHPSGEGHLIAWGAVKSVVFHCFTDAFRP